MNDLELALILQDQYDGKLALVSHSPVDFSILQRDGVTYLLYEGSHDIEDAKRDLEALMTGCPFGRVHSGAWEGVQESLPQSIPLDAQIVCAGHSLGAMRAPLAKRELFRRGYRNLRVLSLEPPHYCDSQALAYSGNANEVSYQNYKDLFVQDIFTMIPPHLILEPYVPAANMKRYYQAPSSVNEYKDFPENVQMHSLSDCVIPYLKTVFP